MATSWQEQKRGAAEVPDVAVVPPVVESGMVEKPVVAGIVAVVPLPGPVVSGIVAEVVVPDVTVAVVVLSGLGDGVIVAEVVVPDVPVAVVVLSGLGDGGDDGLIVAEVVVPDVPVAVVVLSGLGGGGDDGLFCFVWTVGSYTKYRSLELKWEMSKRKSMYTEFSGSDGGWVSLILTFAVPSTGAGVSPGSSSAFEP